MRYIVKWKAQSYDGIRFRTEQPQMRKTGLAAKTAVYLQLGRVMTDRTFSHSFISPPPATPSAVSCFLPLYHPHKKKSDNKIEGKKQKYTHEDHACDACKAECWYVTPHTVHLGHHKHSDSRFKIQYSIAIQLRCEEFTSVCSWQNKKQSQHNSQDTW